MSSLPFRPSHLLQPWRPKRERKKLPQAVGMRRRSQGNLRVQGSEKGENPNSCGRPNRFPFSDLRRRFQPPNPPPFGPPDFHGLRSALRILHDQYQRIPPERKRSFRPGVYTRADPPDRGTHNRTPIRMGRHLPRPFAFPASVPNHPFHRGEKPVIRKGLDAALTFGGWSPRRQIMPAPSPPPPPPDRCAWSSETGRVPPGSRGRRSPGNR